MPYLKEITTKINESIKSGFPAHFVPAVLLDVAYPYPEKRGNDTLIKNVPAIINSVTGEGDVLIDANEDEAIKIYHRIAVNQYKYVQGKTGDRYSQEWTADMYLIVIAARKLVKVPAEDLEQIIIGSMPFTVALNNKSGVSNLLILPYQSEMDFISVFRSEFAQTNYFLKPTQILIKIKYRVTATVDPACITSLN